MADAPARDRSTHPARPRLRDVAVLAGVDISVASRVLRGKEVSVRAETRQRILNAAAALAYVPHPGAAGLKTARTSALGILLPGLTNPAAAAIALGAEEQAAAAGYLLLVASGSARERLAVLEGRVDGLLIASATSTPGSLPDPNAPRVPLLLVNRREPGPIPSIVVDDERGAALATDYLASLGHHDIGHVAGPQNTDTGRRRRAGFTAGMQRVNLEVRPQWIVEGPYNEAGGHNAAMRLLRDTPRPTALLVSNLLATIGVMAAVRRLELRVPEDVSIVAFDDVALAQYMDPPITTIRLPLVDLGRQAIDAMIAMIGGEAQDDVVIDNALELVLRQSCSPPRPRS